LKQGTLFDSARTSPQQSMLVDMGMIKPRPS